jgi:hypothetical protein
MALCAFCKVEETMLYESGVPVCLKCADPSPERRNARIALFREMHDAVARAEAATEAFAAITSKIPSGLPHPDGVRRIQNVSQELTAARNEMMKAHHRLNDFIEQGIVPEDLKRSG